MSQVNSLLVQQTVVIEQPPSNGLGTAGFVLSLIGFITCGLLCPLGFLLSLFGMLKPPRGLAIAGTILGGLGSIWLFFFGFAIVAGFIGIGSAASEAARELELRNSEMEGRLPEDAMSVGSESPRVDQIPVQGLQASPPVNTSAMEAEEEFRTWTDNTGTFSAEAKFVKRAMEKVTLEKRNGKRIELPMDRLSEDDRMYLKRHAR